VRTLKRLPLTIIIFLLVFVIFVVPFIFIILQAVKTPAEAFMPLQWMLTRREVEL